MPKIIYLKGDATQPVPTDGGPAIICHICNDLGAWGAGFVLALSRKWQLPEASYRRISNYTLGTVDIVQVEPNTYVANMIAQHGTGFTPEGIAPIRYAALEKCLDMVNIIAKGMHASIHMPRIGCGLAGGNWMEIEKIINETIDEDTIVYVYDLK